MNSQLPKIIDAIGWALVHFVWQGLVLALVTAFVLFALKRTRAQTRYAVNCMALLVAAYLPIVELLSHLNQVEVVSTGTMTAVFFDVGATHGSTWVSIQAWIQAQLNWFVLGWLLVVVMLTLRLIIGLLWLRNYRQEPYSTPHPEWQRRLDILATKFSPSMKVLLRVVDDIQSPLTIGFIRPVVLVPVSLLTGMAPAQLEALLAHELAHIRRYDFLINLVQNLIEMFLFFHPAVWWISKNIRIERENIADDLAVQVLGEPRRLALALQELEQFQFVQSQLALAAHGGNLMLRIKRLVRPEVQSINWKTAVTAVGIATACVGFAANAAMPNYIFERSKLTSEIAPTVALSESATKIESNESGFDAEKSGLTAGDDGNKLMKKNEKDLVLPGHINFAKDGCRPEYPRAALRKELQGVSALKVRISATGAIEDVVIEKSSGHDLLDDAVKNQLLSGKCTSKPGTVNGKPQQTTARVDYVWKLD